MKNHKDASGKAIALESRNATGARLFSPSSARNRDPIRDVFLEHMPRRGRVLEIGAGTGEHAVHIAAAAPDVYWMPGDPNPESRASIAAWAERSGLKNIAPPHAIDVAQPEWGAEIDGMLEAISSINMIHIAPFAAAAGLIDGAGRLLAPGGKLFLYGPFSRNGEHVSVSNADFDRRLKARDPAWGVRDLETDILPIAEKAGLALDCVVSMPANNFSVILRKI